MSGGSGRSGHTQRYFEGDTWNMRHTEILWRWHMRHSDWQHLFIPRPVVYSQIIPFKKVRLEKLLSSSNSQTSKQLLLSSIFTKPGSKSQMTIVSCQTLIKQLTGVKAIGAKYFFTPLLQITAVSAEWSAYFLYSSSSMQLGSFEVMLNQE